MKVSVIGIILGAIVALIVYVVGTAITQFHHEGLVWGLIALVLWFLIAVNYDGNRHLDVR